MRSNLHFHRFEFRSPAIPEEQRNRNLRSQSHVCAKLFSADTLSMSGPAGSTNLDVVIPSEMEMPYLSILDFPPPQISDVAIGATLQPRANTLAELGGFPD